MDAKTKLEKAQIPLQLGSVLRITRDGEISVSNPELEMEPSEAVADAVLEYSFDPSAGAQEIRLVEPLSYKPRPFVGVEHARPAFAPQAGLHPTPEFRHLISTMWGQAFRPAAALPGGVV